MKYADPVAQAEIDRLQEKIDRLLEMWRSSPASREAVNARYPGLGWAIDNLAEQVEVKGDGLAVD